MRILKFFFLFLSVILIADSVTAKGKADDTLIVVLSVENPEAEVTLHTGEFFFAFEQYLKYQLYTKGVPIKIITHQSESFPTRTLAGTYRSENTLVYFIRAALKTDTEVLLKKSGFSRRSFSLADNVFTIHIFLEVYKRHSRGFDLISKREIVEKSRPDWFEFDSTEQLRKNSTLFRSAAEPKEFVLQRAITRLVEKIPNGVSLFPESGQTITATFYVDSSFIKTAAVDWRLKLKEMTSFASYSFSEQFGYSMQPKNLQIVNLRSENKYTMNSLFKAIKKSELASDDRLSVLLININDRLEYFTSGRYDKVGLAEIGKNQIIVNELPSAKRKEDEWQPFQNSLILIHEMGHTLGAIHVSDQYSVMNSSLNWLASDKFDSFNREIIDDALSGKLRFNNKLNYVTYLADKLLTTDYHLVDIPFMFYTFINGSDKSRLFQKLQGNKEYQPFLLAASGYGYMQNNYREKAASDFRKAISALPLEASLYYYLSLVSDSEESLTALEKAAELGYWEALQKLAGKPNQLNKTLWK